MNLDDLSVYVHQFREGGERAFAKLYKRLYQTNYNRCMRIVKNDVVASSITQDAFFRLWQLRYEMVDIETILFFLKKQIRDGYRSYYNLPTTQFYNRQLRIDDEEYYQNFLFINAFEIETKAIDETALISLDVEKEQQMKEVTALLPNLEQKDRLLIKLCLKYSFSYEHISLHLGGVSDYQIAKAVDGVINKIKSILLCARKLNEIKNNTKQFIYQGELSKEQISILQLRQESQRGFEEIAELLYLTKERVQQQYFEAHSKMKLAKSSCKNTFRNYQ